MLHGGDRRQPEVKAVEASAMSLSGSLRDFSIPDVFRLVSLSGKSGVLHLTRDAAGGSVWFRDGQVFFAQSDRRKPLLGERLVSTGRVSAQALALAVAQRAEEPESGRRIGEILVDDGAITRELLESFVQEQIQDTVFELFLWDDGVFDFEVLAAPPQDQDIGLAVSIENLVMEGARRLADWTQLRTAASSGSVVFRVGAESGEDAVDTALKPSEWRIVTLTDGTRTVREVADAAGTSEFEAARVLYGLLGAGLLQIVEPNELDGATGERSIDVVQDEAPPLFLESEVVLASDPDMDSAQDGEAPAERPGTAEEAPRELPEDRVVHEFRPEDGPGGPYVPLSQQKQEPIKRSLWAGISSEVAALTGASQYRARYSTATPSRRAPVREAPHTIRCDKTVTREELLRIHAVIKEL
jgi:hypothetical protein